MRYNWNTELPDRAFMKVGGRITLEGGGSPAPTQTTQTASTIPPELMPFAQDLMGKTQAVTDLQNNPYQQYQGQRIADFSPLQQQAFRNIQGQQGNPITAEFGGLAETAGC